MAGLMRPWIIAAVSAAVALAIGLAVLWLGHTVSPRDGLGLFVRLEGPRFALVCLAVYAAVALLLTTAAAAFDLVRVRLRLNPRDDDGRLLGGRPTARQWFALFADTSLVRLADRIVDIAPFESPAPNSAGFETPDDADDLVLQSGFDPQLARREVMCHCRNRLVQAQFATAFVLVAVIVVLGLAEDYAQATLGGFSVPARTAIAALVALAFLAAVARLLIGALTEPLIDAVSGLRLPRLELQLWSFLADALGRGPDLRAPDGGSVGVDLPLQHFVAALDANRDALREAVSHVAASATALSAAARSIAERPNGGGDAASESLMVAQLHRAIARLTTSIERLPAAAARPAAAPPVGAEQSALPEPAPTEPAPPAPRRRRGAQRSDLGSELRRLISEFE